MFYFITGPTDGENADAASEANEKEISNIGHSEYTA